MASGSRPDTPSAAITSGAAVGTGLLVRTLGRGHADHALRALIPQRAGHRCTGPQFGAHRLGPPNEGLVEAEPGAGQSVVGEAGQVGPVQFEPDPAADDPRRPLLRVQPSPVGIHAHLDQLLDRARGQPVAADLFPGNSDFSSRSTRRSCLAR